MTYPNVLVLDYLQTADIATPELQLQAESYIATGYQRLLSFEVDGGGFSLFGNAPAQLFLTAYGLFEFTDMARVYPVDEAVIERTAQWLLSQQQADGSWADEGFSEHWRIGSQLPTTAYISWALIEAGFGETAQIEQAITYLRQHAAEAEDPYWLALVANALVAYQPEHASTEAALNRLAAMAVTDGDTVYWTTAQGSFMGSAGQSGSIETTALASYALLKTNRNPALINGSLAYLIQAKDSFGTWQSTQATILTLRTFILSARTSGQASESATVTVSLNKELTESIDINPNNADVVHYLAFDKGFSPTGQNRVQLEVEGDGNLMYQVTTSYYLPWEELPPQPDLEELMDVSVAYDRTALNVNDTVRVEVEATLNEAGVVKMALLDLGIPPGFTVLAEDLRRLVGDKVIAQYELTGRQAIIYLEDFSSEQPLKFSYRLQARFPMRAQTPASIAYDYYNPTAQTTKPPFEMVVTEE